MTRDDFTSSSISSLSSIASSNLASSIQPVSLSSTASVADETRKITKKATKLVTKTLNISAASVDAVNKSLTEALRDMEMGSQNGENNNENGVNLGGLTNTEMMNSEIVNVANMTLNESLRETSDLLDLLTNEEQHRRNRIDQTFGENSFSGENPVNTKTHAARPKSAMVRPNTSFPDSRTSKTTVLLHEVESPSKKTRPKTSSKRSSVNNSVNSNQFGTFSQLTFLPRRPTSSRSSITSSKSCVSQALINQNLSHPTHNKNYSFSNIKVKAIERENMRLYKNLLKINTKKSEINPKNAQNTGFNNKSPVKATHKPKVVRKTSEKHSKDFETKFDSSFSHVSSNAGVGGGDVSITKNKKKTAQRTSTRPRSAVSNISMKSNTSVRSNASTTTLSKRPVTAAQLNRERDRDRIEKDNLRLYTRLQQVKPTLVTRY